MKKLAMKRYQVYSLSFAYTRAASAGLTLFVNEEEVNIHEEGGI